MDKGYWAKSAFSIGTGDDKEDAVILVVGGGRKEAALLTNRPHQTTVVQGNRGGQWRWLQLSPMLEERDSQPGLLRLGGERVLVCGGLLRDSRTAEILQLPRDDSDSKGVWTLLTQKLTHEFLSPYLVKLNHRVIALGELLHNMLPICQKRRLFNTIRLQFRFWQAV